MARRYIRELGDSDGVDEVFLVTEKQLRTNRQGSAFLQLELRDRSGAMTGRLWNVGENLARQFDAGDFLHVKGKVQLYQGALQMILTQVSPVKADKLDPADFLPQTEQDISKLLERMRTILFRQNNHHMRALAEAFLMDEAFVRDFSRAPAGIRNHHAYVGGLLEHVVTLLEIAERVLPLYPSLDRDLLLMGIFLHDVGKVRELSYQRSFAYTDEGQLIGHLIIGVEMLNEKIVDAEQLTGEVFPQELKLRLKHMILSHHGTYEYGSPKLPMTPEAIALHHLDNFDAKVHSFTRDIREDRNPTSAWTQYNPNLQRKLFKGFIEGFEGVVPEEES
jgi:3'-5' exoribonuclease